MRRMKHLPLMAGLAAIGSLAALPAAAQPVGRIFKGSGSTVYLRAADGKRYTFPNDKVFRSWFPNGTAVEQTADEDVARVPFGGLVAYRPGTTLVKVTTDPRVYAVDRAGTLRWIRTEAIARSLYGDDWAKKVVDLPDEFFASYRLGTDIESQAGFDVQNMLGSIRDPDDNLRNPPTTRQDAPTPAQPTQTTVATTIDRTTAVQGQPVKIAVRVTGTAAEQSRIEIRSDAQSFPLATCIASATCETTIRARTTAVPERFWAVVTRPDGSNATTPEAERPRLTTTAATPDITVDAAPKRVPVGSRTLVTSNYTGGLTVEGHRLLVIMPGSDEPLLVRDCKSDTSCSSPVAVYRNFEAYAEVRVAGKTLVSRLEPVELVGATPLPKLSASRERTNEWKVTLTAPTGDDIGKLSTIVDGETSDSPIFAICEATCSVTIKVNIPGKVRAFTDVGGIVEGSNVIELMPQ